MLYFFQMFGNQAICSALGPLQVPEMIRKMDMKDAGSGISGPQKRLKRLPFRKEADKRGVEVSTEKLVAVERRRTLYAHRRP